MRSSITPLMGTPFETGVVTLDEALRTWNKGASPGLLSRAARAFDEAARTGDVRGEVGGSFARALAGDHESARRRLNETIERNPECAGAYVALGAIDLRETDPLSWSIEAAWALVAARNLTPGVPCIERMLAAAMAASGHFMASLQSARTAMQSDPDDLDSRLWSAMARLYFGGDISAASVLTELPAQAELLTRPPVLWLGAAAGHYARGEFHDARVALRRAIAPLKLGNPAETPLVDSARRWFREVRGFGHGIPMTGDRWLHDVGGPQSDYVRVRAALSALREAVTKNPTRADDDGIERVDVDRTLGELEARTRRGMLEWGSRLVIRGFAEAYLPLSAYFEAPAPDLVAAMGLVVLDD